MREELGRLFEEIEWLNRCALFGALDSRGAVAALIEQAALLKRARVALDCEFGERRTTDGVQDEEVR